MTITSLERRLRKIEASRGRDGCAMFAAWGRTADEARKALDDARAAGFVRPGDETGSFVWPHPEPAPRSRWISFGVKGERDLGDRELELMVEAMQVEAAAIYSRQLVRLWSLLCRTGKGLHTE